MTDCKMLMSNNIKLIYRGLVSMSVGTLSISSLIINDVNISG
jgi:hypothetical protein